MSTRRGEVVFLKDILDEAQACMLDNMENTESKLLDVTEVLYYFDICSENFHFFGGAG